VEEVRRGLRTQHFKVEHNSVLQTKKHEMGEACGKKTYRQMHVRFRWAKWKESLGRPRHRQQDNVRADITAVG